MDPSILATAESKHFINHGSSANKVKKLQNESCRFAFQQGHWDISFTHYVQNSTGAYPASRYQRVFLGGGMNGQEWSWPLTSYSTKVKNAWSFTSMFSIDFHSVVLRTGVTSYLLASTDIITPWHERGNPILTYFYQDLSALLNINYITCKVDTVS